MKLSVPTLDARKAAALVVTLVTVGYWLVIMTFPQFYIFNPLETKLVLFRVLQMFSTVGCVLFASFPLIFAWVPTLNGRSTKVLYLVGSLLWPIAVLVIQIAVGTQGGSFYGYVGRDPIFALNDLIAPVFLVLVSNTLFVSGKQKKSKR